MGNNANLNNANLSSADLSGADLTDAKNLTKADLSGADLTNATISAGISDLLDFAQSLDAASGEPSFIVTNSELDAADLINLADVATASFADPDAVNITGTLEQLQSVIASYDTSFSSDTTLTISDIDDLSNADVAALQDSTSARVIDT